MGAHALCSALCLRETFKARATTTDPSLTADDAEQAHCGGSMNTIGHNAYRTNAVETASPEQLILMCYDGALKFMRRAVRAMEEGDLARSSEATGRAQAIVNELNVTLDMESGGEIAVNLRDLYLFVNRHLSNSIVQRDARMITDCMGIFSDLRESWAQATQIGAAAA